MRAWSGARTSWPESIAASGPSRAGSRSTPTSSGTSSARSWKARAWPPANSDNSGADDERRWAVKITRIEPIPLRVPFAAPFKISQGGPRETIDVLIVRVHTDEGIVGVGETQAWRRQGSAETLVNLVRTIE